MTPFTDVSFIQGAGVPATEIIICFCNFVHNRLGVYFEEGVDRSRFNNFTFRILQINRSVHICEVDFAFNTRHKGQSTMFSYLLQICDHMNWDQILPQPLCCQVSDHNEPNEGNVSFQLVQTKIFSPLNTRSTKKIIKISHQMYKCFSSGRAFFIRLHK